MPHISDTVQITHLESSLSPLANHSDPRGFSLVGGDKIVNIASSGSSFELGPSTASPTSHGGRESSSLDDLSLENSRLEKSVDVYRKNLHLLENKVKAYEAQLRIHAPGFELEYPEVSEDDWVNEIVKLQEQLNQERHRADAAEAKLKIKDKEMADLLISGTVKEGAARDRLIKTLQDQIQIRDDEIEFYKSQRHEGSDEQRKVERLLISGIHALSQRYHEEMVARMSDQSSEAKDFFSEEYKIQS